MWRGLKLNQTLEHTNDGEEKSEEFAKVTDSLQALLNLVMQMKSYPKWTVEMLG